MRWPCLGDDIFYSQRIAHFKEMLILRCRAHISNTSDPADALLYQRPVLQLRYFLYQRLVLQLRFNRTENMKTNAAAMAL